MGTVLFLLSILTVLLLLFSGYCYGKVFQKLCSSLGRFSCTSLGTFLIFALFQIWIYFSVSFKFNTVFSLYAVFVIWILGPVAALVSRVSIKPQKSDFSAWITALICIVVICIASAKLNLNSIYFDTITYLSETLESSQASHFAYMLFDRGTVITGFDPLHDFAGYYYFWGMVLRAIRGITHISTSLTPVYIWSGTLLYAFFLGDLISNSILLFNKKTSWLNYLIILLVVAPYYTNYFSTTLAFFGNALRTITSGWSIFLAYLILVKHEHQLFFPLTVVYYMSLCATSSGMFLSAFAAAVLAFSMAIFKESDEKVWKGFILSCTPIVHYAMIYIFSSRYQEYFLLIGMTAAVIGILWLIAYILRNHLRGFDQFLVVCLPLAVVLLVAVSLLYCRSEYPISDFFKPTGMSPNFFAHESTAELIRNIIWYILLICMFFNFRRNKKMKVMIILFFVLFLNPLVMPAVEKYMTSYVYIRAFDLVISPTVLVFLMYNFGKLIPGTTLNIEVKSIVAFVSCILMLINIMDTNNGPLRYKEPGWDWKLKVSPDSYEMYQYIQDHLSDDSNRPSIMSQDINLKGYVTGISIQFCSTDFREALANPDANADKLDLVRLLYPSSHYAGQKLLGEEIDYSKLPALIMQYNPDYLLISNQTAVWNDKGWYDRIYVRLEGDGLATIEYQNDTWALLKINHDYQAEGQEG